MSQQIQTVTSELQRQVFDNMVLLIDNIHLLFVLDRMVLSLQEHSTNWLEGSHLKSIMVSKCFYLWDQVNNCFLLFFFFFLALIYRSTISQSFSFDILLLHNSRTVTQQAHSKVCEQHSLYCFSCSYHLNFSSTVFFYYRYHCQTSIPEKRVVHLRVASIIRHWLQFHFSDFDELLKSRLGQCLPENFLITFVDRLVKFLDAISHDSDSAWIKQISCAIDKAKDSSPTIYERHFNNAPPASKVLFSNSLMILCVIIADTQKSWQLVWCWWFGGMLVQWFAEIGWWHNYL